MSNPFAVLGGGRLPGPLGSFQQMMQKFQQFKATFQGDPKAEVERLVQSGRMSQDQLNQLQMMAKQFHYLMGG